MKTYAGDRTIDGVIVTVNGKDLHDHIEVKRFTNGGFEWGFEGLAATQLALALLYDHIGDAATATRLAKPFMEQVTANFGNEWEINSADIDAVIEQLQLAKTG